jgi:hypothetical protein
VSTPPPPTSSGGLPPESAQLLTNWYKIALKSSGRHAAASDHFERFDSAFGLTSTALAAIVGSTVFITLQQTTAVGIKVVAGLIGLIAAVASAIQTTAKFGARAEKHRQASRQYGALVRAIEEVRALPPMQSDLQTRIDSLRKNFDDAGMTAPDVPPKIWRKAPADQ